MFELARDGLAAETERTVDIHYKGVVVGTHRLDVVVAGRVILELKAMSAIAPPHFAQALSYLKASGLHVALVVNFGEPGLTWRRIVRSA